MNANFLSFLCGVALCAVSLSTSTPKAEAAISSQETIRRQLGETYHRLIAVYIELKEYDQAIVAAKKLSKLMPRLFEENFSVAEIEFYRGSYDKAQSLYSEYVKNRPLDHYAQFKLLLARIQQGKQVEVRKELEEHGKSGLSPVFHYAMATIFLKEGKKQEAMDLVEEAAAVYPPEQNQLFRETLEKLSLLKPIGEAQILNLSSTKSEGDAE